jgi:mycofactocin system glycosyltransferase
VVGVTGQRFVLDSSYRRPACGRTVIAGSPLRLFRLSAGGVRVVEAIEQGGILPTGHAALTERLVDAGAIHPWPEHHDGDPAELTVVLPAYGVWPQFRHRRCRAIVVDDASARPLTTPADVVEVELVRRPSNGGPGAARNTGSALVETSYVAFVDSDVDVDEDDLLALLAHFDDPRVALVAPRVVGDPGDRSVLGRYEMTRSPLDMGSEPARIAATTRVSYVPAAVIICRVEALRAAGGFDPGLRYGEDVDLVWRLAEAGWRCRYDPLVVVHHRTRRRLGEWMLQRARYGTSAAPLARRHPGRLSPVRMSGWSAGTWATIAAGWPVAGATIGIATTMALVRKLRDVPATESIRLAGLGHLWAGRLLAATVVRVWWPVAVAAAMVSRRARQILAVSALVTVLSDQRYRAGVGNAGQDGQLDLVRSCGLRLLDDVAYGAGTWVGMVRERTLGPVLPAFTSWPGRPRTGSGARHQP